MRKDEWEKSGMLDWLKGQSAIGLPQWEDFPALELYMDQVIFLLNQYIGAAEYGNGEKGVTPSMVNNYVKLKIIPPPNKKRYGKAHLAYLVMVCLLKQSMNTGDIKKLLPLTLDGETVRARYAAFLDAWNKGRALFVEQALKAAPEQEKEDSLLSMVFRSAAAASLAMDWNERMLSALPPADGKKEQANSN